MSTTTFWIIGICTWIAYIALAAIAIILIVKITKWLIRKAKGTVKATIKYTMDCKYEAMANAENKKEGRE